MGPGTVDTLAEYELDDVAFDVDEADEEEEAFELKDEDL